MRERLQHLISRHSLVILCLLIFAGGIFRFYDLNWGAPFYFHPDERNIASSISQLSYPESLNPNFFAYGSFPIYVIYFIGLSINFFTSCNFSITGCQVSFEQAIIISRIFSALYATLIIPLIYLLGKKIKDKTTGIIAAVLGTFSVGFIQFSHFGTFEMWTAFFATVQLLLAIIYFEKGSKKSFYGLLLVTGILASVKISNLALLLIPTISILARTYSKGVSKKSLLKTFLLLFFLAAYTGAIFVLTNPYLILDQEAYMGALRYESGVALGTTKVFYTGEFINTTPVLFQLTRVFPFLLNPVILPAAILGTFYAIYLCFNRKKFTLFLVLCSLGVLFFSQVFFYVKWVRYMLPALPFIYVLIAIFFTSLLEIKKHKKIISPLTFLYLGIAVLSSIIFSVAYISTVFVTKDSRIQARDFALKTLPADSLILSEVYDLGITPFNDNFHKITLFNFYDLDHEVPNPTLSEMLTNSDYLILPSQRILATRRMHPEEFPASHSFYGKELISNKFTKIYETPCDLMCKIIYLNDPLGRFEGTANVFDRPTVMIFKINK